MSADLQYLRIVDWDDFQYSDLRKKPNPPWRWCRLPRVLIDSPHFQQLTMAQRGAFCWLLMLASETGNLIPDDARFLRNRIQLDTRLKLSLMKVGLIEQIALPADSPKVKNLRRIYSGGTPEHGRRVEEEGEKKESRRKEEREKPPPPNNKTSSFDDLKREVLDAARRLKTCNADFVWREGKSWLTVCKTKKQFDAAWQQLSDAGELPTGRSTEDLADEYGLHQRAGESDDDFRKRVVIEQTSRLYPKLAGAREQ